MRVTSRFDDHSLTGLFALMHEVGHGLYEHGIDPALERTTLGSGVSLGVHESQSRLWENLVGRSPAFWTHWLPRMRDRFPLTLRDVDLDAFIRAINIVRPTLIRVEADEVTYSLHVILRYELELALIEGTLDVGRPAGRVGGEDEAVSRHRRARRPPRRPAGHPLVGGDHRLLPDVRDRQRPRRAAVARRARRHAGARRARSRAASSAALRVWLREKIHRHGRLLSPPELIEQAVGGPLDPAPMLEHLRAKYGALYGL